MKVACVDYTAADRVALQKTLDEAYEKCRSAVGHINLVQSYPSSKDEVLLNKAPDVIVVGSHFQLEDAYSACREFRNTFPETPIILFLAESAYSLRALRRFERVCTEVFSNEDPSIRIIHKMSSLDISNTLSKSGKLIPVIGVKGGVGTTTAVSGLAHAAESIGKSAVVIDLSPLGAFAQYMSAQRWQSPDFAAALSDRFIPDRAFVERCLTTAPNGVNVLLPPAGGSESRELWLRNPQTFELTLSMIDILRDMYDYILVDMSAAEGVLPFALQSRANAILLVTSNDPASVHLLNSKLTELIELPGDPQVQILINLTQEKALSKEDVVDFLYMNDAFAETMALLEPLPFDPRGRNWIGTGNTFYTECEAAGQLILEDTLQTLGLSVAELETRQTRFSRGLFAGIKRFAERARKTKKHLPHSIAALPEPSNPTQTLRPVASDVFEEHDPVIYAEHQTQEIEQETKHTSAVYLNGSGEEPSYFYQSPTLATNETEK